MIETLLITGIVICLVIIFIAFINTAYNDWCDIIEIEKARRENTKQKGFLNDNTKT